jgi:hypothetical protein
VHTRVMGATGDVLLVVGNGLAMDLAGHFPGLRKWNTQRPLSWRIPAPGRQGVPLLDVFPRAKYRIAEAQAPCGATATDFDVFDAALKAAALGSDPIKELVEIRHFVTMSYAAYQMQADRFVTAEAWPWGQFIGSIAERLQGVISYNYDLNAETVLETRTVLRHLALPSVGRDGLPISKPHGSIDYVPASDMISGPKPRYPVERFFEMCDVPIQRLPRYGLSAPRIAAQVVIPTEASGFTQFQWVKPGRTWVHAAGRGTKFLILMGVSYWPVDRPELDEIMDAVPESATAIVGNPRPDSALMARLGTRFRDVIEWRTGPQRLP